MVYFHDVHTVPLQGKLTARDFAQGMFSGVPRWLTMLLDIRDLIGIRLGFATQLLPAGHIDLREGGAAGLLTFTSVSDECVVGGNSDRHMHFMSVFSTAVRGENSLGFLENHVKSNSWFGTVYLAVIWPFHKLLMSRVLVSSIKKGGLHVASLTRSSPGSQGFGLWQV